MTKEPTMPTDEQAVCPTCASDDPKRSPLLYLDDKGNLTTDEAAGKGIVIHDSCYCPDPFHAPASESGEQAVCSYCGRRNGHDQWCERPASESGEPVVGDCDCDSVRPASESGERWTVEAIFTREHRMVNTNWGPEPHEPVAVELEPDGDHGWPLPGDKLVPESRALEAEQELSRVTKQRDVLECEAADKQRRLSRAEAALRFYAGSAHNTYAEVQETRPGGRARSYFTSPTADSARSESSAGELSVSHTPDNCDPQSCLASERESDG